MLIISAIALASKGFASYSEGVYIAEKESVVFFSESFQIVNLKNEEKIIFYSNPIISKKETKVTKRVKIVHSPKNIKNVIKKDEIVIPIRHIVFNVKNTKKLELSTFQEKDTNIKFYNSSLAKTNRFSNRVFLISVNSIYFVQKQINRVSIYGYISDLHPFIQSIYEVFLLLSIFFYLLIRKKSKYDTYILKRGPPISI